MYKIGTDICSVKRIALAYEKYGNRFLRRILTDYEYKHVLEKNVGRIETLAGRFAAKEAVAKILGISKPGLYWQEIEIFGQASGAPSVVLKNRAQTLAAQLNLTDFEISLSHEREFAIAVVLAYKKSSDSGK